MLIRLYGPVELDTGTETQRIAAPKRACVLAALAESPGTPVSVVDLITRVWGADAPDSAVSTLYSYITRLRAMFRHRPGLRLDRLAAQGYVLHAEPGSVDVQLVRDLAGRARRLRDTGALDEAVELWRRAGDLARGEALVSVGGRWAAEYRTVLRSERLQLLTERYTAELDLGHHTDAVVELAEVVAREPLFEPLTARYLLALYRCGRAAEALDRYEELRVRLRDHSGADPSNELRNLHQAMLRQDPSLDPPDASGGAPPVPAARPAVPAQLPAETAGFHGRDTELTELTVRAGRGGVVVIDGMAGVGKTALALRAAHRLASKYPDGQLFVDLHGYAENLAPMAPETALARLLRALDAEIPTDDDVEERAAALRTALAGRRMLLLLDNAFDAEQVRPLLPGTADCAVIVTSRRRLVDLVDSHPVSLPTLPLDQAAELFAAEAAVDADAEALRIAELCGGLPLAVRIAASRLRHRPGWDTAELARRLSRGHTAIRELDGAGGGVSAAFRLSYRDLDEYARRQFRVLSVFPGSEFDADSAAAMAGVEPADAEPVLELLVDAQLLSDVGGSGYRMHDLLREYATQLVEPAEREAARLRLAERYLAVLHATAKVKYSRMTALSTVKPRLERPAPEDPFAWLHAELPVLERLIDTAVTGGHAGIACDLSQLLLGCLMNRFSAREIAIRLAVAEHGARAAATLGDQRALASMTAHTGSIHSDLADFATARLHLNRALELRHAIGDPDGAAVVLTRLANTELWTGHLAAAIEKFGTAIAIADAAGNEHVAAVIRVGSVGTLCRLGRVDEGERFLDRAQPAIEAAADRFELMRIDHYRGIVAKARGDHREAADRFQSVIDYCNRNKQPHGVLGALSALADNDLRRHDFTDAAEHAQQQLELLGPGYESPSFEARALRQIGTAKTGLGEHDDALTDLLAAEQLAREVSAELEAADIARALGDLHRVKGDPGSAHTVYQRALEFYEDGGFPDAVEVRQAIAALDS